MFLFIALTHELIFSKLFKLEVFMWEFLSKNLNKKIIKTIKFLIVYLFVHLLLKSSNVAM